MNAQGRSDGRTLCSPSSLLVLLLKDCIQAPALKGRFSLSSKKTEFHWCLPDCTLTLQIDFSGLMGDSGNAVQPHCSGHVNPNESTKETSHFKCSI